MAGVASGGERWRAVASGGAAKTALWPCWVHGHGLASLELAQLHPARPEPSLKPDPVFLTHTGCPEVVAWLLAAGADLNVRDDNGCTGLHLSCLG